MRQRNTTIRHPIYRSGLPEFQEREETWATEARNWVESQIKEIAPESEDYTVADFLSVLDQVPAETLPPGYVRLLDTLLYSKRYALVRAQCEKLHRSGFLQAGTTVNAKGVSESLCYRKAPEAAKAPTFSVELEGQGNTLDAKTALEAWLSEYATALGGLDSVLISRVTDQSGGTSNGNTETSSHDTPVVKRRARAK